MHMLAAIVLHQLQAGSQINCNQTMYTAQAHTRLEASYRDSLSSPSQHGSMMRQLWNLEPFAKITGYFGHGQRLKVLRPCLMAYSISVAQ